MKKFKGFKNIVYILFILLSVFSIRFGLELLIIHNLFGFFFIFILSPICFVISIHHFILNMLGNDYYTLKTIIYIVITFAIVIAFAIINFYCYGFNKL